MTKKEYGKQFHDFPDALSAKGIADMLRVNIKTAYKLIRSGTLPSVKIGREYRVAKDEVINFLRQRDKESTNPKCVVSVNNLHSPWTCENSCSSVAVAKGKQLRKGA